MAKVGIATPTNYGSHKLGHRHITTLDFGRLQPILVQECVPGDQVDLSTHTFITAAPNPSPINGKMIGHMEVFFVPNRVVWDGWNNYIAGMSAVPIPSLTLGQIKTFVGSANRDDKAVLSSIGLPVWSYNVGAGSTQDNMSVSVLPLRAVTRIWWDYYRDSNVIPDTNESSYINKSASVSSSEVNWLLKAKYRCYGRNYFTTALRSPNADGVTYSQSLPFVSVPIAGIDTGESYAAPYVAEAGTYPQDGQMQYVLSPNNNDGTWGDITDNNIQTLRAANALQRFFEKCNVLGGRLIDRLRGMFNSSVSPITLQMAEYLGSTAFDINFDTTSASAGIGNDDTEYYAFGAKDPQSSMQGQLRGKSTATGDLSSIKYHAKEHGFLIVLASIVPDPLYYQGIDRMWKRGISTIGASRFDFLTEEMVGLGFQPITFDEVCMLPSSLPKGNYNHNSIFGYAERYADYKYSHDRLSGDFFGTSVDSSMRSWHLGRNLWREAGVINANGAVIQGKTGTDILNNINRDTISQQTASTANIWDEKFTVADGAHDHFVADFKIDLTMVRPLPSISFPTIELHSPVSSAKVGGTRF